MTTSSRGFTLIEILIACALIGILSAIAGPFVLSAKNASNEASAIGTLRALVSGENVFAVTCGGSFYTTDVPRLAEGGYVSPDVAVTPKSGYRLTVRAGAGADEGPSDCLGGTPVSRYYATSTPVASHGRRAFATTAVGTIWQDWTGTPPAEPFTTSPTAAPIE